MLIKFVDDMVVQFAGWKFMDWFRVGLVVFAAFIIGVLFGSPTPL